MFYHLVNKDRQEKGVDKYVKQEQYFIVALPFSLDLVGLNAESEGYHDGNACVHRHIQPVLHPEKG